MINIPLSEVPFDEIKIGAKLISSTKTEGFVVNKVKEHASTGHRFDTIYCWFPSYGEHMREIGRGHFHMVLGSVTYVKDE